MPCLKSARTELPHTSYKQQHKSVYHWVLEAYSFFVEAQNRMVNQQDIRTRRSFEFEKARVFLLFPYLCFLHRFLRTFQFSFAFFRETALVSYVFPYNFAREIGARVARSDSFAHAQRLTIATKAKLNSQHMWAKAVQRDYSVLKSFKIFYVRISQSKNNHPTKHNYSRL